MTFDSRRGGLLDQRWVAATNVGSETIPSWGLVEIAGTTVVRNRLVYQVKRPTAKGLYHVAANGVHSITSGGYGRITFDWPAIVVYNSANSPAVGEMWGTTTNSFLLTKLMPGFVIVGSTNLGSDRTIVAMSPPPATGYDETAEQVPTIDSGVPSYTDVEEC